MAKDANTPRKASAKLICSELQSLKIAAGILVKTTRAYKRPSAPDGLRQEDVARPADLTVNEISRWENSTFVPPDPKLQDALNISGFDLTKPGGKVLLDLFKFIRDRETDLRELEKEMPT
jgi:hypothetical protein